eukprot:1162134-Pelagomonas_calceolata.AAC.15
MPQFRYELQDFPGSQSYSKGQGMESSLAVNKRCWTRHHRTRINSLQGWLCAGMEGGVQEHSV